jgi:uncharacterized protein YjbK
MPAYEIEIKIDLLSEMNRRKLLDHFVEKSKDVKQENYFFDTEDWCLSSKDWALRIRIQDGDIELAAKGPTVKSPEGTMNRLELKKMISSDEAYLYIKNGFPLSVLDRNWREIIPDFSKYGFLPSKLHFVNYRTGAELYESGYQYHIEIDKTILPDNSVDYELELELGDETQYDLAIKALKNLFGLLNIPMIFQRESKYGRAIKKLFPDKKTDNIV